MPSLKEHVMAKNENVKVVSAKVDPEQWNKVLEKAFPELHDVKASKVIPFVLDKFLAD